MSTLSQFWQRLTSLQKVSLISLALVLLTLPAGLILVGQQQEIRKKATGVLASNTTACDLGIFVKFKDITSNGPDKFVDLSLKQPGTSVELWKFNSVPATTNTSPFFVNDKKDLYRIGFGNANCGTYDIYLKSNGYQEKKFLNVLVDDNSWNDPELWLFGNEIMPISPTPTPSPSPTPTPRATIPPGEGVTQTLNLNKGYNFIGIKFDNGPNYKATDFLKELNSSFSGGSNKITYIFRYNVDAKTWESPTALTGATTANFSVVPWEAYIIYSRASGTARISGGGVGLPDSIRIPSNWSLWSTPTSLADIPDAKTLLAKAKEQGIDLRSVWKWDAGAKQYVGHRRGQSENNSSLVPGEGYWIYNGGSEKQFSLVTIPLPPVP